VASKEEETKEVPVEGAEDMAEETVTNQKPTIGNSISQ